MSEDLKKGKAAAKKKRARDRKREARKQIAILQSGHERAPGQQAYLIANEEAEIVDELRVEIDQNRFHPPSWIQQKVFFLLFPFMHVCKGR
jgi:hypothetical protein